jgi:hypothetical protein
MAISSNGLSRPHRERYLFFNEEQARELLRWTLRSGRFFDARANEIAQPITRPLSPRAVGEPQARRFGGGFGGGNGQSGFGVDAKSLILLGRSGRI